MTKFKSIRVDDLIVRDGRMWRVTGCYHGALNQESMIGLECLDMQAGMSGECTVREMLVPIDLIPAENIFRKVDHALWEAGPPISRDTSPAALAA